MATSAEAIIRTYASMVYRLAFSQTQNRSDAEDVSQEVFLRYFKKAPVFESEEHRRAWLIRVTVNCAKKLRASAFVRRTVPLDTELPFQQPESFELYWALRRLSAADRTVLHLFYYEDQPVSKIAELLEKKESTIRSQLTRARQRLKQLLKENDYVTETLSTDER